MSSSHPYYNTRQDGMVVVQGTVVQGADVKTANYQPDGVYKPDYTTSQVSYNQQDDAEIHHGQVQQKRCNDVLFAILFYAHLGVMIWTTVAYAPVMAVDVAGSVSDAYQNRFLEEQAQEDGNNNGDVQYDTAALWVILGVSAVAGFAISALFLSFMMRFAEGLIKFALWFNIITPLLMAILAFLGGAIPVGIMFLLYFCFTAYFAYVVWSKIPFAAANMKTAVTAVRANFGLTFFAFNALVLSFFWTLWWAIAAMSTIYVTSGCTAEGCETEPSGPLVFGLLLSYYWTVQVIKNVCHTTVCGTVGTWWFHPQEASSCCSKAICDSFFRSITYSFGSICLGSLIVAIIQTLKEMARQAREQGDSALFCIAECLLGCLESIVEYFNQWAYVYVALYGYSFLEAGKNVMQLFRSRGWTSIITDFLVDSVLAMVSLAVGIITGVVGALVLSASGLSLGGAEAPSAFVAGFVIGALFASTLLGVVSSACNTVIVCYAEDPAVFQQNHPQLSEEMRQSWRQAYPDSFNY